MLSNRFFLPVWLTLYLCLSVTLGLLSGCAAPSLDVSLCNGTASPITEPVPTTIGVKTFIDGRPQSVGNQTKTLLGLIPGTIWLEIDSDLPEIYTAFSSFNSIPLNENLARAIADNLEKSGIADNVVYLPNAQRLQPEYVLEGILRRSLVKETGYYYGSAVYVWIPRILGAPYVSYNLALEAELWLRDAVTNQVIWHDRLQGQRSDKFLNIYKVAEGEEGKHLLAYHFTGIIGEELKRLVPGLHAALLEANRKRQ